VPILLLYSACARAGGDPGFHLQEIAAGVFVHQGAHVPLDDPRHDDIANISFVVGERCAAVIDTGGSRRTGEALLRALRERTGRPVCWVINTHVHFDHVLGNAAFIVDRPEFVGHSDLGEALAASGEYFAQQYAAGPDDVIGPGLPVQGRAEIDLGGRILELVAHPPAHTYADLSVFDRATGTLWLGDLLFVDRAPALDGDLSGWIGLLEEWSAVPAARAVPGHGPAAVAWPQAAEPLLGYLRRLRDEVRAGIARGLTLEEMVESASTASDPAWRLYGQNHGRNVGKAYLELEWE
jgi:quinoprotein relay system zinc metallohydrolase 2